MTRQEDPIREPKINFRLTVELGTPGMAYRLKNMMKLV